MARRLRRRNSVSHDLGVNQPKFSSNRRLHAPRLSQRPIRPDPHHMTRPDAPGRRDLGVDATKPSGRDFAERLTIANDQRDRVRGMMERAGFKL